MGRDEELARPGLEELVAFFEAGAAHQEGIRQLVDADEQVAAPGVGASARCHVPQIFRHGGSRSVFALTFVQD